MKKYCLLLGVFLCIFFLGLIFFGYIYLSWSGVLWRWDTRIAQGNLIIQQIEEFKRARGRIPEGLYEIGFTATEMGPLYYENEGGMNIFCILMQALIIRIRIIQKAKNGKIFMSSMSNDLDSIVR